ncbi:hypothetical protein Q9189_006459 [Teloschistes chrysophthalmus]
MEYGSITPCVLDFIQEVNGAIETYEEQQKHTGEGDICAICHGTFRPMAILSTSGPIAMSHSCPLCRQPAFQRDPYCHGDNLVILRARIRLANLARECCGINPHMDGEDTVESIADLLERRAKDNVNLDEREIPLDPAEAKGCFLIVRLMLIEDAYARLLHLNTRESIMSRQNNLMLLINFFTHFVFRPHHRNYFFDSNPRDVAEWDLRILEDEPLLLYTRPQIFCRELRLKADEDLTDGSSSDDDDDDDGADSPSELRRRGSVERANNARIRMAISALLDDSHDHEVEMEETSTTTDRAPQSGSPFVTPPRRT